MSLSPELKSALETFMQEHKVVLFMKGTKQFPQVCLHMTFQSFGAMHSPLILMSYSPFGSLVC